MKRIVSALFCLFLLSACGNALYYYDKANLALSVEGRPDPTGPVQVAIAYKQRTVVVAPPKDKKALTHSTGNQASTSPNPSDSGKKPENDAVAMIGSFHASHSGGFGKTVIQTAFLTGDAAIFEEEADAQKAAKALSTASASGASALPTADDNAKRFIETAKKQSLCSQVAAIFGPGRCFTPFNNFTDTEKSILKKIQYFDEDHNQPLFTAIQQQIGDCK